MAGEALDGDLIAERVARLSRGQLDCLLLVDQHLNSKEIAAELHVSPHTIDQRIRQALGILGVARRTQAARMVAQYNGAYQRLIHQSPYIVPEASPGHPQAAVSQQIRHADRTGEAGGAGFTTEQGPASSWPSLQSLLGAKNGPNDGMTVGPRLLRIATIGIGAAFSTGIYLAGLESLARLLKS